MRGWRGAALREGEEQAEVLTDRQGRPIRALAGDPTYAVFNRGTLSSRAFGLLAQITDRRTMLGGSNVFTLGTSLAYGRSAFAATTELGTLDDTRGAHSAGPVIAQEDNAIAPVSVIARNLYAGTNRAPTPAEPSCADPPRRQGIELSLTAQRGGLRVAATYAFTDATNRSPVRIASPGNPAAEDGAILVQPGDRLPGVPRHSANLNVDYAGKLGAWRRSGIGGTVSAPSGQVLLGDESNRAPLVPG